MQSIRPPVYAKLRKNPSSSKEWQCYDGCESRPAEFPEWLKDDWITGANGERVVLRNVFQKCKAFRLGEHLRALNILYYLVVKEHDTPTKSDSQYSKPCAIQIYVGDSTNGVFLRWSKHCTEANKVLKSKLKSEIRGKSFSDFWDDCRLYSYQKDKSRPYPIVACYLALAAMRKFHTAVFVVGVYADKLREVENALITSHAATDPRHGLNVKYN